MPSGPASTAPIQGLPQSDIRLQQPPPSLITAHRSLPSVATTQRKRRRISPLSRRETPFRRTGHTKGRFVARQRARLVLVVGPGEDLLKCGDGPRGPRRPARRRTTMAMRLRQTRMSPGRRLHREVMTFIHPMGRMRSGLTFNTSSHRREDHQVD